MDARETQVKHFSLSMDAREVEHSSKLTQSQVDGLYMAQNASIGPAAGSWMAYGGNFSRCRRSARHRRARCAARRPTRGSWRDGLRPVGGRARPQLVHPPPRPLQHVVGEAVGPTPGPNGAAAQQEDLVDEGAARLARSRSPLDFELANGQRSASKALPAGPGVAGVVPDGRPAQGAREQRGGEVAVEPRDGGLAAAVVLLLLLLLPPPPRGSGAV